MADREQSSIPKPHPTSGSRGQEREHGVKDQRSPGHDAPDQSKEKNTEIAVEAGKKGDAKR